MQAVVPTSRQLIYKAEVRLKVADMRRTSARLDSLVKRTGGFVSGATETRSDEEWRQDMTIRVAPGRFQPLLNALATLGTIQSKTLSTEDVTAEHADVTARLRTKRALEQRYLALLSKAKKVSEILEIEAKIGETREDIEATESRLKTMDDQIGYSTISLSCYQPVTLPTPEAPVLSFASRVVESFYGGWQLVTGLVLALVYMWPLLLIGAALWWGIRRWRQQRQTAALRLRSEQA